MPNKQVDNVKEQIYNTLIAMYAQKYIRFMKEVVEIKNKPIELLTWDDHIKGRYDSSRFFTSLEQYIAIYETGSYHCILSDGSIIRVLFKFNNNVLVKQSLLYWPAPINIPVDDIEEIGIRESIRMHILEMNSEGKEKNNIIMRSPIRYDYDIENDRAMHPASHIHMQHAECRISARQPICFNTFIRFIFQNFYPNENLTIFNKFDFMNFNRTKIYNEAVIRFDCTL